MWLTLLAVAVVVVLVLRSVRRDFTAYSRRKVEPATVEYGDRRGLPAVRVTLKLDNVLLVKTETFRIRADAEDYFTNFGTDELAALVGNVISLVKDKS